MELLNSALVHAGPVISLAFAADSAQLFTTSLDGTVFGLTLEGLQQGSGSHPPPVVATLEVSRTWEDGWSADPLFIIIVVTAVRKLGTTELVFL